MMKEQQNVIFASNSDIKLKKGNFFTPMTFQYSAEDFLWFLELYSKNHASYKQKSIFVLFWDVSIYCSIFDHVHTQNFKFYNLLHLTSFSWKSNQGSQKSK